MYAYVKWDLFVYMIAEFLLSYYILEWKTTPRLLMMHPYLTLSNILSTLELLQQYLVRLNYFDYIKEDFIMNIIKLNWVLKMLSTRTLFILDNPNL